MKENCIFISLLHLLYLDVICAIRVFDFGEELSRAAHAESATAEAETREGDSTIRSSKLCLPRLCRNIRKLCAAREENKIGERIKEIFRVVRVSIVRRNSVGEVASSW